jgi:pentose-5-phosphate-3-epimerase
MRGATTLVAGSAIFAAGDPAAEIRRFREAAASAATT